MRVNLKYEGINFIVDGEFISKDRGNRNQPPEGGGFEVARILHEEVDMYPIMDCEVYSDILVKASEEVVK